MSINNIVLNATLLEGLYSKSLVTIAGTTAVEDKKTNSLPKEKASPYKPIACLGKNQQQITIVVAYQDQAFLPDEHLKLLTTILQACNLNMGDVAIVNYEQTPANFEQLKTQLSCKTLLLFGLMPKVIDIPAMPAFTVTRFNECSVMWGNSINDMMDGAEARVVKSKLWLCLKGYFGV
jgi:hypothetical protein